MNLNAHQLRLRARTAAGTSILSAPEGFNAFVAARAIATETAIQARRSWQGSASHAVGGCTCSAKATASMYRDSMGFRGPVQGLLGFEVHRRSGFPPE